MPREKKTKSSGLWDEVTPKNFESEDGIEDRDIGAYNTEEMALFALNVNCARQLLAVEDSLIPVQRRILWVMYQMKAYDGKNYKSADIVGRTMAYHPHGDASVYMAMVNMAQPFKKGVPFIRGEGNFGTPMTPNDVGAYRYTEASISDYGYECFFEDFDPDCVPMQPSATRSSVEPIYLPTKFPNILIAGAPGLGYGFSANIPPFYIGDVIDLARRLINDPDDPDIYIYPDPPTDRCEIVYDRSLRDICDKGQGALTIRSRIDIEEEGNNYVLHIRSVPWLTSLNDIDQTIGELCAKGVLPFKDRSDRSRPLKNGKKNTSQIDYDIDYCLILNKAFDPLKARAQLYKLTDLQKTIAVQLGVVEDGIHVEMYNIRTLMLSWLNSRREYLRRLLNKKLARLTARIDLLNVLIKLTDSTSLVKVVKIIRESRGEVAEQQLMERYGMSSYHAHQIIDMPLRRFTAEMHEVYIKDRDAAQKQVDEIMAMIRSEKKIDQRILEDLEDLKKYCPKTRHCTIVHTTNDEAVSDTEHLLVFTKKGKYKKLPAVMSARVKGFGTFDRQDYPIQAVKCKNLESVIVFDSTGRFSSVPVHEFSNTLPTDTGEKTFTVTKLQGEIVGVYPEELESHSETLMKDYGLKSYVLTLTRSGFLKRTELSEFRNLKQPKSVRCVKLLRTNDSLVEAAMLLSYPPDGCDVKPKVRLDPPNVFVYTQNGEFTMVKNRDIPILGRDTQGSRCINMEEDDACIGFALVPPTCQYLFVLTDRGFMKIVEIDDGLALRKKASTYIINLEDGGHLFAVRPVKSGDEIHIGTKSKDTVLKFEDVPVQSRKAKGKRLISLGGENIINARIISK